MPDFDFEPSGSHCPLCKSKALLELAVNAHDAGDSNHMTVQHCPDCDFAWQWPLHRDENQSVDFFDKSYSEEKEGTYFDKGKKREICKLEIEFLNSISENSSRILDVGCGGGTFAELAFQDGWSVCGIDPAASEPRTEDGNGRRLQIVRGTLADLDATATFDFVTMWDVVEHLERPLEVVAECKRFLSPKGWLVIETGNFQSTGRVLAERDWWCYQHDHRWYFTPESLQQLLRKVGFARFSLSKRTLRPWTGKVGPYEGPSRTRYLLASCKRPWTAGANLAEFRQLSTLSRKYPETANLQIFALAAQMAS